MTTSRFFGLRARLLLLVLLGISPAFVFLTHDAVRERGDAINDARTNVQQFAEQIADEYRNLLGLSQPFLVSLSESPEIRPQQTRVATQHPGNATGPNTCGAFLAGLVRLHPRYLNIGVISADGELICSALPYKKPLYLNNRAYFRRAIETRKFSVGEYQVGHATGKSTVNVAYRVIDGQDKVTAVVFVAIDLDWLGMRLLQRKASNILALTVLDRTGTVLTHYPRHEQWVGQSVHDLPLGKALLAQNGKGVVEAVGLDGEAAVFGFAPLHHNGDRQGYVSASIAKTPLLERVNRTFVNYLALLGGVALLIFALAWWAADVLVLRRVSTLTRAAQKLGAGDLGVRTGLTRNGDEVAALGHAFDTMANGLQAHAKALERSNRALRTLSASNRTLLSALTEQSFLADMCRVTVERGGYRAAWVGYAEQDEKKSIRPVAQFGFEPGDLERLGLTWADTEQGDRLSGISIRTRKPRIVRNMLADPRLSDWHEHAKRYGFASAVALPVRIDGAVIGTLTLFAAEPDAFDDAEVKLLGEVADDVGFGIGTLRARIEQARVEKRFADLYELSPDALVTTNSAGVITMINRQAETIFGWSRAELVGQSVELLVPEELRQAHIGLRGGFMRSPTVRAMGEARSDLAAQRKDGTRFPVNVSLSPMEFEGGRTVLVAIRDVTEHRHAEQTIRKLAYFDALTGLANSVQLQDRLRQAITEAQTHNRSLALLTLNIARFHDLVDGLGLRQAEKLLQEVSQRLQGEVTGDELLARVGRSQFAILLPKSDARYAAEVAVKLPRAMHQPFEVDDMHLDVEVHSGIALYPGHGTVADELILNSDIAARQASIKGHDFAVYEGKSDQQSPDRLVLLGELRRAIESDQLLLHYQPKVDIESGRVCGVEALVRWQHPERGLVPPGEFISLAEYSGLIKPLTYWVINAAMRQCMAWQREGLEMPIAVNLSARNLHDPELIDRIEAAFATWGVTPARLQIEITESTLMEDPATSLDVLARLNKMGIQLFIDDFGTGYSSLGYLATLPVDALKIDRSFIIKMANEPDHMAIVSATVSLAHALDLKVVAEGVDAEEQAQILRRFKCDQIQGYLYSRPLAPEKFRDWHATFKMNPGDSEGDSGD
ncbi:MAG: EAL domain-containing protein [Candidatus Binataceae bacterium]|nr:EAL domain-containing protein [Candidatus Binataceae bacterium]